MDNTTPRMHRCVRCLEEFPCTHGPGDCAAQYDVLPNLIRRNARGEPEVVPHCPEKPDWAYVHARVAREREAAHRSALAPLAMPNTSDSPTPPDVAALAREALGLANVVPRGEILSSSRAPELLRALARAVLDREGEGMTDAGVGEGAAAPVEHWATWGQEGCPECRAGFGTSGWPVHLWTCPTLKGLAFPVSGTLVISADALGSVPSSPSPVVASEQPTEQQVAEAWQKYDQARIDAEKAALAAAPPPDGLPFPADSKQRWLSVEHATRRVDAARARLTSLLSRTAGAPADDTARLDWLEREGHSLMYYGGPRWDVGWGVRRTPREAIDAAMADPDNLPAQREEARERAFFDALGNTIDAARSVSPAGAPHQEPRDG